MPTVDASAIRSLPGELTRFVGRDRELGEVKALMAAHRLVTVTGMGGVGKTRLALRAAAEVRRGFGGAVCFVDLAQLQGPGLLAQDVRPDTLAYLVLAELGLRQQGGEPPVPLLTRYLNGAPVLLVLDNCEHLITACATLVDALLRACPAVRVLATGRETLAIRGEMLYPLPPLSTPAPGRAARPDDLTGYDSVALLLARARESAPDFGLTEDNAEPVAELCRRLDGLPLAIELAAARMRSLHPAQILDRLADRFAVLSRGNRIAPARQRTLRACVEWSFELCVKSERVLWARLSVFAGGFDLDAVEGVCGDACLPVEDLIDVLAGLVDKSIVDRADDGEGGQPRYRMLQTIREYGAEQLLDAGEQTRVRRRHRDWYQRLAERAASERISDRQVYWIARLTGDHANVRAAVEFCLAEPGEAEAALRLVTDLPWLYWSSAGPSREGLAWLDQALRQAVAPSTPRARALLLADFLAAWLGDTSIERPRLDEGESLARRLGDGPTLALAGFVRGTAASQRQDLDAAIAAAGQALAVLAALPERERQREVTLRLQLLLQVGPAAALTGDHERARACFQEALELAESRGATVNQNWAMWGLGLVAWRRGHAAEADEQGRQCLRFAQRTGLPDPYITALTLEMLAWTAARQESHQRAATLLGAAGEVLAGLGRSLIAMHRADHDECEQLSRTALGQAAFAAAHAHGRAFTVEDAVAYALDEPHRVAPPPVVSTAPLTRRERQVADLIADGLPNKVIAETLFLSRRTVESHVEHIFAKLGFTNRAQVAAWVAGQRPSGGPG
jgi:predicted ATPase/DNA-binding CsgD family transcriptional regulator